MEIDIGAAVSILSSTEYDKHFSHIEVKSPTVLLKTVTGKNVKVMEEIGFLVCYEG